MGIAQGSDLRNGQCCPGLEGEGLEVGSVLVLDSRVSQNTRVEMTSLKIKN